MSKQEIARSLVLTQDFTCAALRLDSPSGLDRACSCTSRILLWSETSNPFRSVSHICSNPAFVLFKGRKIRGRLKFFFGMVDRKRGCFEKPRKNLRNELGLNWGSWVNQNRLLCEQPLMPVDVPKISFPSDSGMSGRVCGNLVSSQVFHSAATWPSSGFAPMSSDQSLQNYLPRHF